MIQGNLRSVLAAVLLLVLAGGLHAQQEHFDIVQYTPPRGWKKESTASALQFSKENTSTGGFCIITVFKSIDAPATPKDNFDATWETVVKKMVTVTGKPEMQAAAKEDGWEALSGHAAFESDGQKGIALLVTSTGYGKMANILVLTNTDAFEAELSGFLGSVNLNKSAGNSSLASKAGSESGGKNTGTNKPVSGGYAFNITNFDDGWTSTIYDDYVLVTKGNIKVYLSYIEKFNESEYSGTGKEKRHHYWNTWVSKYFATTDIRYNPGGALSDYSGDYIESPATDRQTGEKRYIAMLLHIIAYTGKLSVIVVSAPDLNQLRQQFPNADKKYSNDLSPMYNYNKFAVGKNDLVGKWSSNGGGTMNWYSTVTGENVGAKGVVMYDMFQFNANNTYSSEHKGASGWVGSMNTYQQKYNGAYTVSNWQVTASKRWDGKTENFSAWFEAGRGTRALHLDTPGITYTLFKD